MAELLTCPVCGFRFEIGPEGACGACPLHSDCAMACCPACGHSTINPQKSRWAQWLRRWFTPRDKDNAQPLVSAGQIDVPVEQVRLVRSSAQRVPIQQQLAHLDEIPAGESTRVLHFEPDLSLQHRLRLQAFGLEPGHEIEVLQQRPVTIVRIDHMELAVERMLARKICVTGPAHS